MNPQTMSRLQNHMAEGKPLSGWRLWLMLTCQLWAERMGVQPAG